MKKNKKTKKPLKNYFILGAIVLATVFLVIYLSLWYKEYLKYQATIPVMRNTLFEIKDTELSHYIQENDKAFVYLCVPSNDTCRAFENNLKKLVNKRNLKDEITYLNLESDVKAPVILKQLTEQYEISDTLNYYPSFLVFEGGKVIKVLQGNSYGELSLGELEQFLDTYDLND